MAPLRFYFDFISTYAYIAIQRIDDMAARYGRTVDWRAVSLGHLFQAQGVKPPPETPAKFKYNVLDFQRSCARAGLPCKLPAAFPPDVKLARLVFWRLKMRDEALSHVFARAVATTVYGQGESVEAIDDVARACRGVEGVASEDIVAAANDPAAKDALFRALEEAKADGVFGAPFIIVDGEPFWGADRLDAVESKLAASR